jgi:hypothetical protein
MVTWEMALILTLISYIFGMMTAIKLLKDWSK